MIAFGVSVGVLLCVVAVGRIGAVDDSRRDLYENSVVASSDLDAIQASYEAVRQSYTAYYLGDTATRTALKAQLAEARAGLEEKIAAYAGITQHADRFSTLTDDIAAYFAISDGQLVAALDVGDKTTARAVAVGPLVRVQNAVTKDFTGLRTVLRDGADVKARAGADDASAAKALLWAILAVSIGIGLLIALVSARRAERTVRPVPRSVDALPAGDLTVHPAVRRKDELTSVVASSDAVAAPPAEPSASCAQIASSAEASGPQSGVASSAAGEVSRSVQTAAAREVTPARTTTTVARPDDSAAEISDVIKVVRSIVGQTDLLALNAAIDAARAGEAGKRSDDIARRMLATQGDTTAPVTAIEEFSTMVAQISDRQTAIASAVEQATMLDETTEISGAA
jgi:methyl-accepting chemotaxis protein